MQIRAEQLASSLPSLRLPMVWISGDDPLLMMEAADTVREFARQQGFGEREILEAGKDFDWNRLLASGSDLSLFAERKLIDLRFNQPKLDETARKALMDYLAAPNPDNLLLLTTPKVDKPSQKTKWYKALEEQALCCAIWPVNEQDLPRWIGQRLAARGLSANHEVLQVLADRVEGNLLAAAQEVDKLRLLSEQETLELETVLEAVSDSARFNVFALTDACLAGKTDRALQVLEHLRAEGEESLFILTMLCREIRALAAMLADLEAGQNLNGVLQSHRVWSNRSRAVTHALQQHSTASLQRLLARGRRVDQAVKGLLEARPWDELADLVLGFANARLAGGF